MNKVRPIYILYALIILLVNLIIKVWFIEVNDIAHDEPFTLFFAQGNPASIIENLKPYNNPPLYELMLHYWIGWFGSEPLGARLLSCIFSSLAAVALFFFVLRNWNHFVAVSATALFTFSTFQISFSHETRAYSLFVLLTILSFHFLLSAIESRNNSSKWIGYIFFTTLLLYTHFFSLWVLFVQLIILIKRKLVLNKIILLVGGVIFIFYLPYFFILIERFTDSASKGTWLDVPTFDALYENIRHFSNQPLNAVLFLGLILIGISLLIKNNISFAKLKLDLLLIWFFVPYLLMFLISFKLPMFLGRYLIFITPAFYILISLLWYSIWENSKWKSWINMIPMLLMLVTVNYSPSNDLEPSKVASLVRPYYEKNIPIILSPVANDIVIAYHLDKDLFVYRENYREYEKEHSYIPSDNVKEVELKNELIFIETPGHYLDKNRDNLNYLKSKYENVEELKADGDFPKGFEVYHFTGLR